MPYIAVTKPNQGEVTRKELIDAIIDNQAYFNSVISALTTFALPNGSFELFTNNGSQDLPDEWTRTLYTGGAFIMSGEGRADTECRHGRCAIKFTHPGGPGNGGGYIESSDFLECSPLRPLFVSFLHRSTVAGIRNRLQVTWYTSAFVSVSTVDIYSSVANPTSWQQIEAWALPPATARYFKLRLVGGENTVTTAGSAYFDDVRVEVPEWRHELVLDQAGSYVFTAPADCSYVAVLLIGAGGGGGAGTGQGAGGGSSGALCFGVVNVTPGTDYAIVIGAGGAGGFGSNGSAGTATTAFGLSAGAGGGGGQGGTGNTLPGVATGGYVNTPGGNGGNGTGSTGGFGGVLAEIGLKPARASNGITGAAGTKVKWGAGGGGGGNGAGGGAGSDGMVFLFLP